MREIPAQRSKMNTIILNLYSSTRLCRRSPSTMHKITTGSSIAERESDDRVEPAGDDVGRSKHKVQHDPEGRKGASKVGLLGNDSSGHVHDWRASRDENALDDPAGHEPRGFFHPGQRAAHCSFL